VNTAVHAQGAHPSCTEPSVLIFKATAPCVKLNFIEVLELRMGIKNKRWLQSNTIQKDGDQAVPSLAHWNKSVVCALQQ
jgi:hypothetical protein